jgi:hypothetical protein
MIYSFNVKKLLEQYTPISLRKPRHLAWLHSLFTPFSTLLESFLVFVSKARSEVLQTGQVGRLETLLNDLYDAQERRIFLQDTSNAYFVLSNSNATIFSNIQSISIADEVDYNFTVDFVVKLFGGATSNVFVLSNSNATIFSNIQSTSIVNQNNTPILEQIQNTVNKYKIAGKSFQIENL